MIFISFSLDFTFLNFYISRNAISNEYSKYYLVEDKLTQGQRKSDNLEKEQEKDINKIPTKLYNIVESPKLNGQL